MILRSISLKNVAGATEPTSFELAQGTTFCQLPKELAPAVPFVVMTLLYPDEMSTSDLARLCGPTIESAWRLAFAVGDQELRLSRGFSPTSVLFEELDPDGNWQRVAAGAAEVRSALGGRLKLPTTTVMEGLNVWINVAKTGQTTTEDSVGSGLKLVGAEDLLNTLYADETIELDSDAYKALADQFRRAQTGEFIDDQIEAVERKLKDAIERLSGMVEDGAEVRQLQTDLAQTPALRELTADERVAFGRAPEQAQELERKLEQVQALLQDTPRGKPSAPSSAQMMLKNPIFMLGAALTLIVTLWSVVGGLEMRRVAFANIVAMGVMLAGYLRHVQELEDGAKSRRKWETIERRRATLRAERDTCVAELRAFRAELGVETLAQYDRARAKRARLEAREAELAKKHASVFATEEYRRAERRKVRVEEQLRVHKQAKGRIGESDLSLYELRNDLVRAGHDPTVALWRPDDERRELGQAVKRLGQIASKYRLISESGLHPKTVASWLKLATRILSRPVEGLTMTAEHAIENVDGEDALESMSLSEAVVVVEALRMSLHLTLIKASAPGIHPFSIQVHPARLEDETLRRRLLKMYNGLGEKMQVLCVDAKP